MKQKLTIKFRLMIQEFIDRLDESQKDELLLRTLEELELDGVVVFPTDGSEPTNNGEKIIDGL